MLNKKSNTEEVMFKGSMVPIVTPFKDGELDEKALSELIEWHISEGTDAIVPKKVLQ